MNLETSQKRVRTQHFDVHCFLACVAGKLTYLTVTRYMNRGSTDTASKYAPVYCIISLPCADTTLYLH